MLHVISLNFLYVLSIDEMQLTLCVYFGKKMIFLYMNKHSQNLIFELAHNIHISGNLISSYPSLKLIYAENFVG